MWFMHCSHWYCHGRISTTIVDLGTLQNFCSYLTCRPTSVNIYVTPIVRWPHCSCQVGNEVCCSHREETLRAPCRRYRMYALCNAVCLPHSHCRDACQMPCDDRMAIRLFMAIARYMRPTR